MNISLQPVAAGTNQELEQEVLTKALEVLNRAKDDKLQWEALQRDLQLENQGLKAELDHHAHLLAEIIVQLEKEEATPAPSALPNEVLVPLIVQKNDTIWGLASRFQSPPSSEFMAEIMAINGITSTTLTIGQKLFVPLEMEW